MCQIVKLKCLLNECNYINNPVTSHPEKEGGKNKCRISDSELNIEGCYSVVLE
jgi:hypothetical protein